MTSRRLGQRYRLKHPLGNGGLYTVWLGYDDLVDREVAVKELRLPAGLSANERAARLEGQLRAARRWARLDHPAIATVHDVIEQDERCWVVMERLTGHDVAAIVAEEGPLPLSRVAEIGVQVVDALSRAHDAGLLHRGLTPSTIMLTDAGRIVITDFGLAPLAEAPRSDGAADRSDYTAPELLRGEAAAPASDLWSLGATLYFVAEGHPPCRRGGASDHPGDPDPPDRALPLWPLLSELLERAPKARPAAADVRRRLAEFDPTTAAETPLRPLHLRPRPSTASPDAGSGSSAAAYDRLRNSSAGADPAPGQGTSMTMLAGGTLLAVLMLIGVAAVGVFVADPGDPGVAGAGDQAAESEEAAAAAGDVAPPAPGCSTVAAPVLTALVDSPVQTQNEDASYEFYSERYCEWRTDGGSGTVDGFVSALFLRNVDGGGQTAEQHAAMDLDNDVEQYAGEPVAGVGEASYAWYDQANSVGCVGTRTDGVYLRICYDAARSSDNTESIPAEAAIDGATRLASDTVAALEQE